MAPQARPREPPPPGRESVTLPPHVLQAVGYEQLSPEQVRSHLIVLLYILLLTVSVCRLRVRPKS